MHTMLFLCSGNYYRSRFAEYVFNALAERDQLPWRADSRGLAVGHAGNIGPISRYAVRGLEQRGMHLNGDLRFPLQVTEQELARADLVIALKEAEHRRMLVEQFPAWADRVEYWHIHDLDCAEPEQALAQLEREVAALSSRLVAARHNLSAHPPESAPAQLTVPANRAIVGDGQSAASARVEPAGSAS
jgi:protein-tyrosine phosphatase